MDASKGHHMYTVDDARRGTRNTDCIFLGLTAIYGKRDYVDSVRTGPSVPVKKSTELL